MGDRQSGHAEHGDGPVPAHLVVPRRPEPDRRHVAAYALTLCEWHYGADWYWNPARWRTDDGVVPWAVFLIAVDALMGHLALERWQQSMAALIGQAGGDLAQRELEKMHDLAFPGD